MKIFRPMVRGFLSGCIATGAILGALFLLLGCEEEKHIPPYRKIEIQHGHRTLTVIQHPGVNQ